VRTIDDTLHEAARDVDAAVATMGERAPQATPPRRLAPVVVLGAAALALLLVGLPLWVLRGPPEANPPQGPIATEPTAPPVDEGAIPAEVLDYWALEGTLVSVGAEEGWLCPASPAGYTSVVADADMPPELRLEIPGREPIAVYNRDDGPACRQPHLLVLLAPAAGDSGATAEAGMTVWPRLNRYEDTCPPDVCQPDEGSVEDLVVNAQPAVLLQIEGGRYQAWWIDESGTALSAKASGLDREQVLELVDSIQVDPATRRASVAEDALGDLEVVSDQASVGVWEDGFWREEQYDVGGANITITASVNTTLDPYARLATSVDGSSLTEVNGIPAVWTPQGDGGFLEFTRSDGVHILIEGPQSMAIAVSVAEQLR
jgi:hypothetical protein